MHGRALALAEGALQLDPEALARSGPRVTIWPEWDGVTKPLLGA